MKFHLTAAVLGWALLSLSCANVNETEQSLVRLKEDPQNVDKQVAIADEPLAEASPEVQKILMPIPELVHAASVHQTNGKDLEDVVENTQEIVLRKEILSASKREPKQLIGFIPSYVLRQAIRLAQEQDKESDEVDSLRYYDDEDDVSDDIGEERAIRRRKRMRRRNSKGHLKKTRRHNNSNKRNLQKRRRLKTNRKTKNRGSVQKKKDPKRKALKKKRKNNKRKPN